MFTYLSLIIIDQAIIMHYRQANMTARDHYQNLSQGDLVTWVSNDRVIAT